MKEINLCKSILGWHQLSGIFYRVIFICHNGMELYYLTKFDRHVANIQIWMFLVTSLIYFIIWVITSILKSRYCRCQVCKTNITYKELKKMREFQCPYCGNTKFSINQKK